jgi:anthranilate phosphoribosyltransferase
VLEKFIPQLAVLRPLSEAQVTEVVEALVNEAVPTASKADFLTYLARKGETSEEIAAFTRELRERAVKPPIDPAWRGSREILDVVGTGGDHLSTFNISTTVALVASAAGVAVAKHGNRAVTSSVGSADVMEALGIPFNLGPEDAARSLREHNFAFFFAPSYHPAFKHIGPARKLCAARGQRTIFNFLGPLLNPAWPTAQLIGIPRPELCEPIARVLQSLGVRRGMVVCGNVVGHVTPCAAAAGCSLPGAPGETRPAFDATRNPQPAWLDELSTLGESTIAEFYQERGLTCSTLAPEQFPLQPATLADLRGGDRAVNAEIIRRILRGEERGPKRDAVLLNAGAALFVAGSARSISEGWELAAQVIDSGKAEAKVRELAGR